MYRFCQIKLMESGPARERCSVPRHYGVRTDRYKLIHYYQLGEWEMFDLERDPQELRSIYGDPAYAGVQADLERELARLRALYRVPEVDPAPSR